MRIKWYPLLISLRLKTLPLALSTILAGNALAYWQHKMALSVMFLSLITASLLQILSNLANDYGDTIKGVDQSSREGPERGIQLGLITLPELKRVIEITICLSIISGLCLLLLACHTFQELLGFLLLGAISIVAAITYTVGRNPYGYRGLGDISVLIFFGLVSIMGSFYLQTKQLPIFLIWPAVGLGLLIVAVLNINNLRDYDSDLIHHKRTLIVLMGRKNGGYYHISLLVISLLMLIHFSYYYLQSIWAWLFLLTLPLFYLHSRAILRSQTSKTIAPLFPQMIKLALLTNLFYCLGIILS
ncbi:1,4-dihydroxy-2-naphthoate polyprenyltransferase [Orbaceae bacterium ESL0721]|nr:1,4-dihydroxy-2-naphthoate polyprenyltransferase [Orbaceae bacterium ESL0721]